MRSVACLLAFGVLCLTTVTALETVSTEQAFDILDTLTDTPVRHASVDRSDHIACSGGSFPAVAPPPFGPPAVLLTFPLLVVLACGSLRDVAFIPLQREQNSCSR